MLTAPTLSCPSLPTILLALDAFADYRPPPAFAARPSQSSSDFASELRLSLALHSPARLKLDSPQKLIAHAASFLEGAAWKWYCALLRENVRAFFALELQRGRRVEHVPRLEGERECPAYWVTYPFVLPELRSLEAFLNALQERFPPSSPNGE